MTAPDGGRESIGLLLQGLHDYGHVLARNHVNGVTRPFRLRTDNICKCDSVTDYVELPPIHAEYLQIFLWTQSTIKDAWALGCPNTITWSLMAKTTALECMLTFLHRNQV